MGNIQLINKEEIENELNELNFPPSDINEVLTNNDIIIVPFSSGKLNKAHIDVEIAGLIKKLREEGFNVGFSLPQDEFPRLRDQRSIDIAFGTLILLSIDVALHIGDLVINFLEYRRKTAPIKGTDPNIKIKMYISQKKNSFLKVEYEGPSKGINEVFKNIDEYNK